MIDDLKSWADWYVSCSGGNIPNEAQAAYDAIDEINYLRSKLQEIYDCGDLGMKCRDIAAEALGAQK